MNALPILLLGGAALMMMGGGKKSGKKVVERGLFESGEEWRIRDAEQWSSGGGVGMKRYLVDVKLNGRWVATKFSPFVGKDATTRTFSSIEEAKEFVGKLDRTELFIDEQGVVSA